MINNQNQEQFIKRNLREQDKDQISKLETSGNDYVDQFINGRAEGPITKHAAHLKG